MLKWDSKEILPNTISKLVGKVIAEGKMHDDFSCPME
jgi:hypothetical protein